MQLQKNINFLYVDQLENKNKVVLEPTYQDLEKKNLDLNLLIEDLQGHVGLRSIMIFVQLVFIIILFYLNYKNSMAFEATYDQLLQYRNLLKDLEVTFRPIIDLKLNNLLSTEEVRKDLAALPGSGETVPERMQADDGQMIGLFVIYGSFLLMGLLLLAKN